MYSMFMSSFVLFWHAANLLENTLLEFSDLGRQTNVFPLELIDLLLDYKPEFCIDCVSLSLDMV